MNQEVIDAKLKNLIQVCKETENYKKLSVVSFILVSNVIDSIGVHLGIRARNKKTGEKIFEYMELVNEVFLSNLKIVIFREQLIERLRECEILFFKNNGELPLSYIKDMYHLFYELRKIEVPNLHKSLDSDELIGTTNLGVYSSFSSGGRWKKKNSDGLKSLILQKIMERERVVQSDLRSKFNGNKLETAIFLKKMKNSISDNNAGKIRIEGSLKDNLSYQHSVEKIVGFLLLGIFITLLSFGTGLFLELLLLPIYSADVSSIALMLFGGAFPLIYIYFKQFIKKRG
ncbi:MAG: hypothetical protein ACFE9Z_04975 [Promethearchaeota archaeon]